MEADSHIRFGGIELFQDDNQVEPDTILTSAVVQHSYEPESHDLRNIITPMYSPPLASLTRNTSISQSVVALYLLAEGEENSGHFRVDLAHRYILEDITDIPVTDS